MRLAKLVSLLLLVQVNVKSQDGGEEGLSDNFHSIKETESPKTLILDSPRRCLLDEPEAEEKFFQHNDLKIPITILVNHRTSTRQVP